MSQVAYYTPNGGTDARTLYVSPRKHRGWGAEMAAHLPILIRQQPKFVDFHLPYGTRDPKAMEFDGLIWARLASSNTARELASLTDEREFLGAFLTAQECCPDTTFRFYLGSPEHSEIFMRAWAAQKLRGIDDRIDSSIRPILKFRDRGGKVGLWIDMACARDKDSLTAYTHERCHKRHGIVTGIETRPHHIADWANRADVPCITWGPFWHHLEGDPVAIPSGKLLGPQWLIEEDREMAKADLDKGLNVTYIGEWAA